MNRIEKIQFLLEEFYNPENPTANHNLVLSEFYGKFQPKDIHEIIYKLEKDGYLTNIEFYKGGVGGNITFEGGLFYESGGYAQQLKDVKSKRFRQSLSNIIVAFGAGLAGLYALWQIYIGILNHFCCHN